MIATRLSAIRKLMTEGGLDGIFLSHPSNIRYLAGYTHWGAWLLVTADGANMLITDSRYEEQARAECRLSEICLFSRPDHPLPQLLAKKCAVHGVKKLGYEPAYLSVELFDALRRELAAAELVPAPGLVEALREIKDSSEEECLRRACLATDKVFSELLGFIRPDLSERQVEWQLKSFIHQQGCTESFPPIVLSGKKTSLPQGQASDKLLEDGDMLTLDYGCCYQGYRADITRTLHIGRYPGDDQRKIYEAVLEANRRGLAAIRAGVSGRIPDEAARSYIAAQGYGSNFIHSLGHGVGLDIHEEPRLSQTSNSILKAGSFVTVEPGVYVPGWGGIRVEDMARVTEEGCENMFTSSKELICL